MSLVLRREKGIPLLLRDRSPALALKIRPRFASPFHFSFRQWHFRYLSCFLPSPFFALGTKKRNCTAFVCTTDRPTPRKLCPSALIFIRNCPFRRPLPPRARAASSLVNSAERIPQLIPCIHQRFDRNSNNTAFFGSSRVFGFRVHHPFQGPLKHLCNLEAGYGGVWAPNFGGAALGFEPQTSCLRVRSVTITLRGPPL